MSEERIERDKNEVLTDKAERDLFFCGRTRGEDCTIFGEVFCSNASAEGSVTLDVITSLSTIPYRTAVDG